jgi:nucleoside-diphosphate-sugar epimerase
MRVLITGANGFFGAHLVRFLDSRAGHLVTSLVRETRNENGTNGTRSRHEIAYGDVSAIKDVSSILSRTRPEVVIHLATRYAVTHQSDDISQMVDTNIKGIYNILESLRNSPETTLINASTCYVYGASNTPINEQGHLCPQNLYALTKICAEEACKFYVDNFGINVLNLRFFPPYGPGDSPKKLIQSTYGALMDGREPILSGGTQKWDYVFVDDVVECFNRSLTRIEDSGDIGFKTLNVGTGKVVEIREIVRRIFELAGKTGEPAWGSAPKRKSEIDYLCCDNRALMDWLGWVPTTPMIGGGLELTIRALREGRGV